MSLGTQCYACAGGDHRKHDRNFGITPGLIGGQYCPCEGDCSERLRQIGDELVEKWFGR